MRRTVRHANQSRGGAFVAFFLTRTVVQDLIQGGRGALPFLG